MAKTIAAVQIAPPNMQTAVFRIEGTAPFVQHKFSAKARREIMEKQAGGQAAKNKKVRKPKDFDAEYNHCMHIAEEGWNGIPAASFRSAMIDACRLCGFQMTKAKLAVFVEADGLDADEGTPLVRIIEGEPERHEGYARNETGVVDIRVRPMWRHWVLSVRVRYDADQFGLADVTNLLMRAGEQVGIGEGRPNSKKSHGMGWGQFRISND